MIQLCKSQLQPALYFENCGGGGGGGVNKEQIMTDTCRVVPYRHIGSYISLA
jgi:hypothetical protein